MFFLSPLSATVYPATPYITPAAGNYSSGPTVSISDSTSGATIYYTTDGSTPTSSSAVYSGTIVIPSGPGSETVKALAVDSAGASSVTTSGYTVTPILAIPTFSPAPGSFGSAQSVTISSATPGAVIEYTLDGTQPTASSPVYSGPISVTQKETIKALVTGVAGYAASGTVADTYSIIPSTPYITPATATYNVGQTVRISDSTPGTTLYYTTDGTAPSPSSSLYSAPFATTTTQGSQTIRAMAVLGGVYGSTASNPSTISPVLAVPSFSPAGGSFGSAQSVTLSTTSPNAIIYYTLDGSSPTTSSPVYSAPVVVTQKTTMKAFTAGVPGYTASGSSSATYSIIPATPYITPATGTYNVSQSVTISDTTPGTTVYYTTDGTAPTPSSAVYSAPLATPSTSGAETVRALAVLGGVYSSTTSNTFTISPILALPVFSPAAGTYTSVQTVTITTASPGGVIYYTTNGTAPTTSSPVYSAPISVSGPTESIAAIVGGVQGSTNSGMIRQNYVVSLATALPVMTPSGGTTYTGTVTVAMSDTTPGAIIYYTLDNSWPSTSSPQYATPLSFSQNTSLKAMALAPGYSASASVHGVYEFLASAPVISPASGTYSASQMITITDPLPGANIYYTIDGSTPTTASTPYSAPFAFTPNAPSFTGSAQAITATGTEVVQAIAISGGYQSSTVAQSTITLALPGGFIATTVVGAIPVDHIATNFLGLAHEWGAAQTMMGSAALGVNSIYKTLIHTLSTNMNGPLVLRIGGNSTDASVSATSATVEPFVELAQNENVNFILGVNLGSSNLSLAQEQAVTFTSSLPSTALMALEIGNEPDGYSVNGIRPTTYAYSNFLPEYQEWAAGVSSAAPGTPIAGPTFGTGNWVAAAQPDEASSALKANLFNQHKYVQCYDPANPGASTLLLQPSSSTGSLWLFQPDVAAAHSVSSLYRMAEMNNICNGGQPGVSNSFSSALWAVDTMFEYANAGMDGVNFNTNSNGGPYDLFRFNTWTSGGKNLFSLTTVNPTFYGLLFFSEAAGNNAQLLPVSTVTNSNIKVWATTDSTGAAHLVIINKELTTAGMVQITMPGYSRGTIVRMLAANYQATNGVTIGGQTYDGSPDGTLQGTVATSPITPTNGVWTIPVNPTSAVLINMQP